MDHAQTFKQAVTSHRDGDLQEAERLYKMVLADQPTHPDANHNLGALAASVNQLEIALQLFETALSQNPKKEQFWLSYIEALILTKRTTQAKLALQDAQEKGLKGPKADALGHRLEEKADAPAKIEMDHLISLYQSEKYPEAERLAFAFTEKFPNHHLGWKVLAATLKHNGKFDASLNISQKLAKASKDPEAHSNLGVTLQELGRLEEAEKTLKKAISLNPNYAEAHYNLGVTFKAGHQLDKAVDSLRRASALKANFPEAYFNLGVIAQELGNAEEAENNYLKALVQNPSYTEALLNVGVIQRERGKLKQAESSLRAAIKLNPSYADAFNNLGVTLNQAGLHAQARDNCLKAIELMPKGATAHFNLGNIYRDLGRIEEAEASYKRAIAISPLHLDAMLNLAMVLGYADDLGAEIVALERLIQVDPSFLGLRAAVNLAICRFLEGRFTESKSTLLAANDIHAKDDVDFNNEKIYHVYLGRLLKRHEQRQISTQDKQSTKTLYLIGESHCLVAHMLPVALAGVTALCQAVLIKGCKQWHLGNPEPNQYKAKFESVLAAIPRRSDLLLTIGEIDCRLDSGLLREMQKNPHKTAEEIIKSTIENFVHYVVSVNINYQHKIIVQGVPSPNIDTDNRSKEEISQLVDAIRLFNITLREKCQDFGYQFLDVHSLTDRGDGLSSGLWHIDDIHLSPDGFLEAWQKHLHLQR